MRREVIGKIGSFNHLLKGKCYLISFRLELLLFDVGFGLNFSIFELFEVMFFEIFRCLRADIHEFLLLDNLLNLHLQIRSHTYLKYLNY
jgi:hypothetical protein